jgi:uncharacterized protein YaeQ
MALSSTRLEYRVTLSNVDRAVDLQQQPVIIARHPSETSDHVTLRVLAWCLLHEERLEFGPGLSDPEVADLWTRDLTGQLTTWIECGTADADKLRKVLLHNSDIAVHAVLSDPRRRDELLAGIAEWKKPLRGRGTLTIHMIDRELLAALAASEERRRAWTVTIVGGHAYVDADGRAVDGAIDTIQPLSS